MSYTIEKDLKKIILNYVISLTLLLYLFRTAIPFLKFPFLFIYSLLLIYIILDYRKKIALGLIDFISNYYLLILITILLVISFLSSNKIYLSVFKDVINTIILLTFLFIFTLVISTKRNLDHFIQTLINLIIVFALGIALLRLFDLFTIFYTDEISTVEAIDYNFAILPVFFGMISVIYLLVKSNSTKKKFVYSILLIIYSFSIFFAGSRRGLFVLGLILLLLIFAQFFVFSNRMSFIKQLGISTRYFLATLIFIVVTCVVFILNSTYATKNKTLELIGTKNLVVTKGEIASTIYRYISVFDRSKSYYEIHDLIWTPLFDPKDPDSGWGSRIHKTVFPLTGDNVEIVPSTAKGYFMDRTTNPDTINGTVYSVSPIASLIVNESKVLKASVYCYVSKECDLSMVEICSLGAMGNPGALYDLQNKGKWQKLSFKVNCTKGNASILLFFSKSGSLDFSLLKGYVVFAFPQVEISMKNDSLLSYQKNTNSFKPFCKENESLNKNMDIYKANYCGGSTNSYYEGSIFNLKGIMPLLLFYQDRDKDPIRKLTSHFISEDSTYHGYKSMITVDTMSNNFIAGRTVRWQFAWQIYSKEFNWKQKVFGGGFNYLNWFGRYFLGNKKISDYPHNPFLSVLLYSGILGLIIYLIFMYNVFYYYYKYYKEYKLVSIFFLIAFFFSFFSAGSPFDPPVMGFFVILPFFIHKVLKNTNDAKKT
jgi:hypothetical protein